MLEDNIIYNDYWERIIEKDKTIQELYKYEIVVNYLREGLLKSNLPIDSVRHVFSILNFVEDDSCCNDSYFYPEELINKDLRRVLEVI